MRYRLMRVQGSSMAPTLNDGDLVIVDQRLSRIPPAGAIVAARPAGLDGKAVVKRVSTVSADQLILLGDNPSESLDSRRLGPVRQEELLGSISCRLWPWKKLGTFLTFGK